MAIDKISAGPTTQRDVDESTFMLDELAQQAERLAHKIHSHLSGSDEGLPPGRDEPPTLGMFPAMNRRLRNTAEVLERAIKLMDRTSSLLSIPNERGADAEVPGPSSTRRR